MTTDFSFLKNRGDFEMTTSYEKVVLGEAFLIPSGDRQLTVLDFVLNPSNIRRILGNFSPENVTISFLNGKRFSLSEVYEERKKRKMEI